MVLCPGFIKPCGQHSTGLERERMMERIYLVNIFLPLQVQNWLSIRQQFPLLLTGSRRPQILPSPWLPHNPLHPAWAATSL